MKKLLTFLAAFALSVACAFGVAACNSKNGGGKSFGVYAPDGAPALSLASLSDSDTFKVNAVAASTINVYVSGDNPRADFAVLPVNAAVKLLGNGERYKMLGTVTHGNLFLLKKPNGENISAPADLNKLVGKTVGVINLANVPGLTLKVILNDNEIAFNELKDGASAVADKVNLKNVTAQEAVPGNADCDYFVVSEPEASAKVAATQERLSFAGNLQTLYGGENGYPQAVAVVKTEILTESRSCVESFISSFSTTAGWLDDENTSAETIADAVKKITVGDAAPTFTASNLSKSVIANCGIRFESNSTGKAAVLAFMEKLNYVSTESWGMPADSFFY